MKNMNRIAALFILSAATFAAKAQTVTLDYYFNHEVHTDKATGKEERFHYMWEDKTINGYSNWGDDFKAKGASLKSLEVAPTVKNLKGTDIYIIVDPDTKKESPSPNYIETKDIVQIEKWVKNGGVLVMMANDSANVELPHFNNLAARFGLHFTDELRNHVVGNNIEVGTMMVSGNPLFKTAAKIYMKDVCSIDIKGPAVSMLKDVTGSATIIAAVKYGRGTVFAVADPWLYNEYTNGHLPAGYDNDKAAVDVTDWLLRQVAKR